MLRSVRKSLLALAIMFAAALICGAQTVAPASKLTLNSPLDYQVFQRRTHDCGNIHVSGIAPAGSHLELLLQDPSVVGTVADHWKIVKSDAITGAFDLELATPAGGFYSLTVRAQQPHNPDVTLTVPHVGVGEIFIVAGQSNSTNYGEVRQVVTSGLVSTFDGHEWRIADDPQPGVQDNSNGGSFIPAFGDALVRRFHVPVGVASVGSGSTSVRQWLPGGIPVQVMPTKEDFIVTRPDGTLVSDGTLFRGLMLRIHQLGPHGFRALLWHQGESDAHQAPAHQIPASTYHKMMITLIHNSRRDAGWDFPWFVAEATYHTPADPRTPELEQAQRSLWQPGLAFAGPNTDTLTGLYRQNNGLGVHMSATGLHAHGRMWADAVSPYLNRVLQPGVRRHSTCD